MNKKKRKSGNAKRPHSRIRKQYINFEQEMSERGTSAFFFFFFLSCGGGEL